MMCLSRNLKGYHTGGYSGGCHYPKKQLFSHFHHLHRAGDPFKAMKGIPVKLGVLNLIDWCKFHEYIEEYRN